ncbi:L-threonylcarbamoyladenylate synthase [Ancylobacter terrae]|uniref:L-threonylcarbamoyladenylate synthase n=1 Tax=Ancylobacter sp. sgz301288 TaxID=3342077 RepID=UPI00385A6210
MSAGVRPAETARVATRVLPADAHGIAAAAEAIRAGGLVAMPTETVYGLAADATDPAAIARLYAVKGRPSFNPLIAHVPDLDAARRIGRFGAVAERLAAAFWPGPLTLVVPAVEGAVCDLARAGLPTLAIRLPAHPAARALIAAVGRPLAAPSANRSGHVSPTSAAHVLADLDGAVDVVLDAGPCPVGVESTIVDATGDTAVLLRPGGLDRARIEALLGARLPRRRASSGSAPLAPGMLASHYAPRAGVRLDATEVKPGEALLAFGGARPPGSDTAVAVLDLSPAGDTVEAAANLFAHLRALDASGAAGIAVTPIPAEGLGEAIRDRLARAAAPR